LYLSLYEWHKQGVKSAAKSFPRRDVKGQTLTGALVVSGLLLVGLGERASWASSSGPAVETGEAPAGAGAWPRACSVRRAVCVHATPGTAPAITLAALGSAERALEVVTGALRAPSPDAAPDGAWHVYLVDAVDGGVRVLATDRDPRAYFDRASSLALVDRSTPPGCSLDLALARAVARGTLWRTSPAVDEGSALAQTEALARLSTTCSPWQDDAAAFQSRPERAVVDPVSPAFDRGASLFFGWLDATFGATPGTFLEGTWALSPTRTPPGAWRWAATPTPFDVLRVSLRDALWLGSTLEDVLARFAVDRASMAPPPRVAWRVPWPARARRLAAPEPVAPTGASFVRVDLAGDGHATAHRAFYRPSWSRMRFVPS